MLAALREVNFSEMCSSFADSQCSTHCVCYVSCQVWLNSLLSTALIGSLVSFVVFGLAVDLVASLRTVCVGAHMALGFAFILLSFADSVVMNSFVGMSHDSHRKLPVFPIFHICSSQLSCVSFFILFVFSMCHTS